MGVLEGQSVFQLIGFVVRYGGLYLHHHGVGSLSEQLADIVLVFQEGVVGAAQGLVVEDDLAIGIDAFEGEGCSGMPLQFIIQKYGEGVLDSTLRNGLQGLEVFAEEGVGNLVVFL
jgi:hypothetical protein